MVSFNPIFHLKHAWSETKTFWGKIALVLFYSWVWLGIVSAVWTLVDPASMGSDCILDHVGNESSRKLSMYLLNGYNIMMIGFLFYADMGGVHTKNVLIAALFTLLSFYFFVFKTIDALMELGAEECVGPVDGVQKWIYPSWVVAALICTILEDLLGGASDRGTTEERRPLSG